MSGSTIKVAYLTAGAAGMYCGSCLHDNTLARALIRQGVDVQLIPLYTPIRTDEEDVSTDRVFFGGVNVYLQQKSALFRRLPGFLDRWLDQPWLIRWAASRSLKTNARELGELTVSVLRGQAGHQRREVRKLCQWLASSVQPQLVNLTNMLIAGCAAEIKEAVGAPVLATLQGDEAFLEQLLEPYKSQALAEIRRLVRHIDGFVVFSRYYADFMAEYFHIPRERFEITPLGVETRDFVDPAGAGGPIASPRPARPPRVGYLARLAPEKGLHVLVDAFLELRRRPAAKHIQLHIAGYLGASDRRYAERQFAKLRAAGAGDDVRYIGEVDRRGKIEFLRQIDVFSAPTTHPEPKGLFVLEALAAGVPVVQPAHGAFPELLQALEGGRLFRPNDPLHLADVLGELLLDEESRLQLGERGRRIVHERFNADSMARATLDVYRRYINRAEA